MGPERRRQDNLPADLTSFVGRERERDEITQALAATRLLTLTGVGGAGKTRLALSVARDLIDRFPDGVWFVELGALADSDLIPQTLAASVGARQQPDRSLAETVVDVLRTSRTLLVLDNCEHLIEACALIVQDLLRASVHLRILATSREPLGVPGEVQWAVPSLGLPRARSSSASDIEETEAVQLFVSRAATTVPGWSLTDRNAGAVAQICTALDGVPLAIELGAARVKVLTPEEIAARLGDRFRLLGGGSRTAPARQQTLRGAVDWSYDLLSLEEQTLFDRLSVFAGSFSLEATEAVCQGDGVEPADFLDVLSGLVDKSLLLADPDPELGETRYRLLETMRAYGREKLVARGEADLLRKRLAGYLTGRAEEAERAFHGPDQVQWLRWAEREHDNVRIALQWTIEDESDEAADLGLRLAGALAWSWQLHDRWSEGLAWLDTILARPAAGDRTLARARALAGAGTLAVFQGRYAAAADQLQESLCIADDLGDPAALAMAAGSLGLLFQHIDHVELGAEAAQIMNTAMKDLLAFMRRGGLPLFEVWGLQGLASLHLRRGEFAEAAAQLRDAADVGRRAGDVWATAMTLNELGDLARGGGDYQGAGLLYQESLALRKHLGVGGEPSLLQNLGYVALAQADRTRAAALFRDALARFRQTGDRRGAIECLVGLAGVSVEDGCAEDATRLLALAEAALEALGTHLWPSNQGSYDHSVAEAHRTLDEAAFAACWEAGRQADLEDVIAAEFAIEGAAAGPTRPSGSARGSATVRGADLTPRELEVARLIARGRSNRQIAEALVITEKTAANHVQHVLDKLSVHSRAQIAAQAGELGLVDE